MATGDYTKSDVYRMQNKLNSLREEKEAVPRRAALIDTEISNLEYELQQAKNFLAKKDN